MRSMKPVVNIKPCAIGTKAVFACVLIQPAQRSAAAARANGVVCQQGGGAESLPAVVAGVFIMHPLFSTPTRLSACPRYQSPKTQ
jgi:hypothetical protein